MTAESLRTGGSLLLRRWIVIHVLLTAWYLMVATGMPDSVLRTTWMPVSMRVALMVEEGAWLLLPALLIAIPQRRTLRWVIGGIVVLLLAGSWGAYETTGAFASLDGIRFFLTVPTQSLEHARDLYRNGGEKYLVLLFAGLILLVSNRFANRFGVLTQRRIIALVIVATIFGLAWEWRTDNLLAASTSEVDDLETGVSYSGPVLWRDVRHQASGPATTLFRSILELIPTNEAPYHQGASVHVEFPPRPKALAPPVKPTHHWNVLVIVVESLREDVLFGAQPIPIMPTAKDIAEHAFRFTHTYTTATQTNLAAPVPLSGQYPLRMKDIGPYPSEITWPRLMLHDVLKPLDWYTAIFSSQNESWWGMKWMLETAALDTLFHSESYSGNTYLPKGDIGFARFVRKAKKSGKIDDYDTASEALSWLSQHRDHPFMLAMNFQNSHLPYGTPAGVPRRFGTEAPSFPILFGRFPHESLGAVINEYHNSLAYVDDQIARVRSALQADGRWDSTLVVITGDHGQAFFEHDVAAHANGLWEEQVDVPLVIAIPGQRGGEDPRPASHVDIAPSIVDALGLPPEEAWQGMTLFGVAPRPDRLRFLMVQTPLAHEIGVVAYPWKLVMDLERGSSRLTNLADDPGERHDLASTRSEITRQLTDILNAWQHEQLGYYDSKMKQHQSYPPRFTADSIPS